MSIPRWAQVPLAALAVLLSLAVHAQTAAPAKPGAKADPKADSKADEAAAAMERAKRLAAGPMRVILEASKGKRLVAEPPAVDSYSLRAVATRAVAAPLADAAERPVPAAQAAAAEPPAAVPAVAPAPAATAVSTQITLSADALQGHSVAPVPGLERTSAATATAMPALPSALVPLPRAAHALAKPKIVSRVDPELPQRLLDDLGRQAVVAVDLSIRADGTVGGVKLATSVPPRLQRAVISALEQWRFEPLSSDRVHRIELLFNGD